MVSSKQDWKNWVPIKLEPLCPVIPFSTFPIYSEKSFHSIYIALSVILNSPYHSKVRMLAFMCEICRHKGNEEGCCLNLISFAAIKSSNKSASRRNGLLGSRLSSPTAGEVKVVGVLGHPHQERGDEFLLACLSSAHFLLFLHNRSKRECPYHSAKVFPPHWAILHSQAHWQHNLDDSPPSSLHRQVYTVSREMAQWLRAGSALAKDPSLFPNTQCRQLTTACNFTSVNLTSSSLHKDLCMCKRTHSHIMKLENSKLSNT